MKDMEEVLKDWDENKSVWSIEMGGLGPGYEQCIQIGIMELSRDLLNVELPSIEPKGPLNDALDEVLHKTINRVRPALDGLSGAQAGVIQNVAYQFKAKGYKQTMDSVSADRKIQISKEFPSLPAVKV